MNSINFTQKEESNCTTDLGNNSNMEKVAWATFDLLFLLYCLLFLVKTMSKHKNHFEPVHIFTINTLIDVSMAYLNYNVNNLLQFWPESETLIDLHLYSDFTIWFWFILDVISQVNFPLISRSSQTLILSYIRCVENIMEILSFFSGC